MKGTPNTGKLSEKTHSYDGSFTLSELRRRDRAFHDAQPVRFTCVFCDWLWTGPAAVGRVEAAEHRRLAHRGRRR